MLTVCLLLVACRPVISSPDDELRLYSWRCELDNGNTASLSFDGANADFRATVRTKDIRLSGLCATDDDTIVICDSATGAAITLHYVLYGDRVELCYQDAAITLDKIV